MSAPAIGEERPSSQKDNGTRAALAIVIKIAITVFVAEAAVMLLLSFFAIPPEAEALLDATLLTLLVCPGFYYWVYLPQRQQVNKQSEIETSLRLSLRQQQKLNDDLNQAQNQVVESERLASLGLLTAGIAHEIRGPVSYVDANLKSLNDYCSALFELINRYELTHAELGESHELTQQLMKLRDELDIEYLKSDTHDLINESLQGTERVKKIIENYKDFSRKSDDEWEEADLHHCIESTLSIVWNELKYHTEVIKAYGQPPPFQCVPSQINQVIMNMLVNAAHAIKDKGTITLSTGADEDQVWLSVQDTGCGMTEEQKNRIFEPFFTTKPRGKGTGLGLAISMGIIEKHNGEIKVESTPGEGTTFKVLLPQRQPEASSPSNPP